MVVQAEESQQKFLNWCRVTLQQTISWIIFYPKWVSGSCSREQEEPCLTRGTMTEGLACPCCNVWGLGNPCCSWGASLGRCITPSCNTENFDGPEEAVCSYGQIFLMVLDREDEFSSHTGRFKQEKSNQGTFPACIELCGAIASSQALPFPSPATTSTSGPAPCSSPSCCRRFLGTWPEGKGSVILSFPECTPLWFCREQRRGSAHRRSAVSSSAPWSCWWGLSACASPFLSAASSQMSTRSPW